MSTNNAVAITTKDNPYSPFTQFEDWYNFDVQKGYNTCAYLGRVAFPSRQLSDEENLVEAERAIDQMIKYDVLGIYKKVYLNTKE